MLRGEHTHLLTRKAALRAEAFLFTCLNPPTASPDLLPIRAHSALMPWRLGRLGLCQQTLGAPDGEPRMEPRMEEGERDQCTGPPGSFPVRSSAPLHSLCLGSFVLSLSLSLPTHTFEINPFCE